MLRACAQGFSGTQVNPHCNLVLRKAVPETGYSLREGETDEETELISLAEVLASAAARRPPRGTGLPASAGGSAQAEEMQLGAMRRRRDMSGSLSSGVASRCRFTCCAVWWAMAAHVHMGFTPEAVGNVEVSATNSPGTSQVSPVGLAAPSLGDAAMRQVPI